jgi:predicted DNA repair protein MutK
VAFEKEKIKGAVRTDFILSAEIVVIALGTVATAAFSRQVAVLCSIAAIMTVGVYGLVAGIVKLDDAGLALTKKASSGAQAVGRAILRGAPYLMKGLSIAGTVAMFLVGGGIVVHGIGPLHHLLEHAEHAVAAVPGVGGILKFLVSTLINGGIGIVIGAIALAVVTGVTKVIKKKPAAPAPSK